MSLRSTPTGACIAPNCKDAYQSQAKSVDKGVKRKIWQGNSEADVLAKDAKKLFEAVNLSPWLYGPSASKQELLLTLWGGLAGPILCKYLESSVRTLGVKEATPGSKREKVEALHYAPMAEGL
eukprot:1856674-Amphidinium_carterae.2